MTQILIIEDAEDVAQMFARFLESHGYDCAVSFGGEEGIKKFEEGGFDLVIADLLMPQITGYDVAERIRRRDRLTPMLLLTGQTDDVLVAGHAKRAGFDDVLYKPVDPGSLLLKVRELTERKGSHAAR